MFLAVAFKLLLPFNNASTMLLGVAVALVPVLRNIQLPLARCMCCICASGTIQGGADDKQNLTVCINGYVCCVCGVRNIYIKSIHVSK